MVERISPDSNYLAVPWRLSMDCHQHRRFDSSTPLGRRRHFLRYREKGRRYSEKGFVKYSMVGCIRWLVAVVSQGHEVDSAIRPVEEECGLFDLLVGNPGSPAFERSVRAIRRIWRRWLART